MLMLTSLGMLMAPVMAIHPCRVAMIMVMTMVMECHSPCDLSEVCTL